MFAFEFFFIIIIYVYYSEALFRTVLSKEIFIKYYNNQSMKIKSDFKLNISIFILSYKQDASTPMLVDFSLNCSCVIV